ncbi:MAG: tRNA lysidine(34) synthetase TilS [Myxococcaceae bacterium]
MKALLERVSHRYRHVVASPSTGLLAVSGGADSTALLLASHALSTGLGMSLHVAYIDHGLRPAAAEEVQWVKRLSEKHRMPFHTRALHLKPGPGVEARARAVRYEALEVIRHEVRADWVATAHTASDQAETLLIRLSRGASLVGAGSIRPERGQVIRPLLDWTRDDVLQFLKRRRAKFLHDEMNDDLALLRTRIRKRVLPALRVAAGDHAVRALARFAEYAGEDAAFLRANAERALAKISDAGRETLENVGFAALEQVPRRWVLATFLEGNSIGVDGATLERVLEAMSHGRASPVRGDGTLRLVRGRWILEKNPPRRSASGRASE